MNNGSWMDYPQWTAYGRLTLTMFEARHLNPTKMLRDLMRTEVRSRLKRCRSEMFDAAREDFAAKIKR